MHTKFYPNWIISSLSIMQWPVCEKAPKICAKNFPTTRYGRRIKRERRSPAIMKKINGVKNKVTRFAPDNKRFGWSEAESLPLLIYIYIYLDFKKIPSHLRILFSSGVFLLPPPVHTHTPTHTHLGYSWWDWSCWEAALFICWWERVFLP